MTLSVGFHKCGKLKETGPGGSAKAQGVGSHAHIQEVLLKVWEDISLAFQSLFLHVVLALLTSFRNVTVASVKKACCKPQCVGTELNFPKMWVVWTQCFSLLTSTESGPGINQMKTKCGKFFHLVYVRFGIVSCKVHLIVREEFVYWEAGAEIFKSSHLSFGAEWSLWVNDAMICFIICEQ